MPGQTTAVPSEATGIITGAIGIVGGVGPYAGLDLMRKIMDMTPARRDQDHLPILHFCCPNQIADRTDFLSGRTTGNPGETLGRIMVGLVDAGATVLGMPCNTAHSPAILDAALNQLHQASCPARFVHMIDAVGEYLRTLSNPADPAMPITKVGLLSTIGTWEADIYPATLGQRGISVIYPDASGRERVQQAIYNSDYGVKAQSNPVSAQAHADFIAEARVLIGAGAQAVILGCTEIPLALTEPELDGVPLVDATAVLAKALITALREV